MIQIKKLDHIVLRAKNPVTMIQFYCQVLGCHVERETSAELGLTQLRAGDFLIDIVAVDSIIGEKGGEAPRRSGHNLDHFCVQIEPFDEGKIREHLKKYQVKANPLEIRYGANGQGPSIYIQDPQGNTIELKGISSELP